MELLRGGVQRAGIEVALTEISGWEGRLAASGDPELGSVAEALAELHIQLEGGGFDPVTVGALMTSLRGQVEKVAGRLSRLAPLLGEQGDSLSNGGMEH